MERATPRIPVSLAKFLAAVIIGLLIGVLLLVPVAILVKVF